MIFQIDMPQGPAVLLEYFPEQSENSDEKMFTFSKLSISADGKRTFS